MAYWLCVTNRENWEVIRKRRIWGVSSRSASKISKVKRGDTLVFYKIQDKESPSQVVGIFEATSDPFYDEKPVFSGGVFPHRVRVESRLVPEEPLDFKPLVPKLSFITNKEKWNLHLRGKAMIELPKEDFEAIISAMKR